MAAKQKKTTKNRVAKKSKKPEKKAAVVAKRKRAPTSAMVVRVAVPTPVAEPAPRAFVLSFEMVARRAFLIWERKTHTNYPEQNWREAEAELRAEFAAKK